VGRRLPHMPEAVSEALDNDCAVIPPVQSVEPLREAAIFGGDALELTCVADGGQDLPPVSDDPPVLNQALDILGAIGCDEVDVEAVEGLPEARPLVSDRAPAEGRLGHSGLGSRSMRCLSVACALDTSSGTASTPRSSSSRSISPAFFEGYRPPATYI